MHPSWQLPRDVVLFLLVMELLASYDGRDRPARAVGRPRDAAPPRGKLRASRGALCGRRPRG